jgi:hypothetical protein
MAFFLPSPRAVAELSRYAVGQVVESAAAAATVPVRVFQVLGQVELLVNRLALAAERAETLIDRVDVVVGHAEDAVAQTRLTMAAAALAVDEAATVASGAAAVVDAAAGTVDGAAAIMERAAATVDEVAAVVIGAREVSDTAAALVRRAAGTAAEAGDLLDSYGPTLRDAAPLARRFVAELTQEEVTAAIKLIDHLPRLREHLANDVMPLLGTLDKVGPDVHALLDVTRDLHLAVAGIPGLRMLRRRGEDRIAEEEFPTPASS